MVKESSPRAVVRGYRTYKMELTSLPTLVFIIYRIMGTHSTSLLTGISMMRRSFMERDMSSIHVAAPYSLMGPNIYHLSHRLLWD